MVDYTIDRTRILQRKYINTLYMLQPLTKDILALTPMFMQNIIKLAY